MVGFRFLISFSHKQEYGYHKGNKAHHAQAMIIVDIIICFLYNKGDDAAAIRLNKW